MIFFLSIQTKGTLMTDILEILSILTGIVLVTYPASFLVERILRHWDNEYPEKL
jgi:hypothetical protein